MLTTLSISEYAIAKKLQIDLKPGMTVITGETGAGKSISLDALSLALGSRADSAAVRAGAARTDIRAVFDLHKLESAKQWLKEHELDDDSECILRRTVNAEGRSKAYINGQPVNLSTLTSLGSLLVDIHSQHAHHQLMKREHHQNLLDAYGKHTPQLKTVEQLFKQWQELNKEIHQIESAQHDAQQRKDFLSFQLEEFKQLNLQEDEYQELEKKHAIASQADALIAACQHSLMLCKEQDKHSIIDQIHSVISQIEKFSEHSTQLRESADLLNSALIQVDEAAQLIRQQLESQQNDNSELGNIEERLSAILALARKQRVLPDQLLALQQRLENELHSIEHSDETLTKLREQADTALLDYYSAAKDLSKLREKASATLKKEVKKQLSLLGMEHCIFDIALNSDSKHIAIGGTEQLEFLISTNPASKPQALSKIASGGELSRISLAIQVVTAQSSTIPVLIFDEVDVGIGGATAEVVGRLLKQLSKAAQVICVTHQAQVASFADQHLLVSKELEEGFMNTQVSLLNTQQRVAEIARMIGGVEITKATLQHAKEMIKKADI